MSSRIYVASLEPRAGRSVVTLGLMELLTRRLERVGYFRPVVPRTDVPDHRIELIRDRYGLTEAHDDLFAYTAGQVADLVAEGRSDEVFKGILERSRDLEERYPFVLYDGTDFTRVSQPLEFEFNARLANHLGAPVLALVNGRNRWVEDVVDSVRIARESLLAEGCTIAATIVNRVDAEDVEAVRELMGRVLRDEPAWAIPEEPVLGMPTVGEIADALGATDQRGEPTDLDREVSDLKIAAMTLPNLLDHVEEGTLLMTPGDRADIVVGAMVSRLSATYPNLAGIVLTGGIPLAANVVRLLDGLPGVPVPVLAVETDTYTTAQRIADVPAVIHPDSDRKIATALGLFEEHVDTAALERRIEVVRPQRVTPLMFEYELIQRARSDRKHIVLPEGTDERILRAAEVLRRRNVVDLTLLGGDAVRERAASIGIDLDDIPVLDPVASELRERFAETYHELRAHRGMTLELAYDTVQDVGYFGTLMVHEGLADGMVSGAAHTTQHTIRPAFEIIRTRPDVSIVSSVFLMCLPDRVLVYGDCAVNPEPDAEQLADIAISSAETARMLGIEPRVAMLSYSTGESGKGRAVERVREATTLVRERAPDLEVEGPIQYDAAVDVSVGEQKLPGSTVAGRATVFVFPDLNTGNNTYKAVQRSAGAVAIGPVLQGLNKPVNDLSRGCLVDDVVNTVAITAIQAQEG